MHHRSFAVVMLLAACAPPRSWHVSTPRQIPAISADSFFAFQPRLYAGGIEPGGVQPVDARCVDPSVCEARFVTGEMRVIAKRPGATNLVIDAVNAMYNDHEHHTLPIVVTAAPARAPLVLGAAVPAGAEVVEREGEVDTARCTAAPDYGRQVYSGDRPDVHVYVCSAYLDVEDGRRFRSCEGALCMPDGYVLCAQERDGAIAGIAKLVPDAGNFAVASTAGTFGDRVCTPRL